MRREHKSLTNLGVRDMGVYTVGWGRLWDLKTVRHIARHLVLKAVMKTVQDGDESVGADGGVGCPQ